MPGPVVRRYRDVLVKMGFRPEFSFLISIYGLGAEGLNEAGTAIRARDVNSMLKGVKVVPVPEGGLVRFGVEMFLAKVPPKRTRARKW